jgi:acyl-CoA synthetase (AMP-forming)/AMP-acid ligase II/3-hydroxymyristoyl/3-hydroxydecanoyl-(acyl carrier protein) dehydratase
MALSNLLCGAADLSAIVAVSGERRIDLVRLRCDVGRNADALRVRGCRRGLLAARDTYWAAVGMLALFQAGAVVVMPPNALPATLSSLAGEWDCLVCDEETAGIADQHVLVAGCSAAAPLRSLESEACVLELFTSGSSGEPKRVVKTLGQMEREAGIIESLLSPYLSTRGVVTGTVSHQHLYGLSFRLFWPLCSGRAFDPVVHEFWESLVHRGVGGGAVIASPAHLTRIPGTFAGSAGNRPGVIVSAGAPLPQAAALETQRLFAAPVFEIYGSTETGVIAWRLRENSGEAWRPIPGATVQQSADGRVLLASPLLAAGTRHEGNDRIELLPDGRFHLRERTDRIAKIEGKRVSLAEVERRLLDLPDVASASVVVLPGGEPCLAAAVVVTPAGARSLTETGAFRFGRSLRKQLGAFLEPASLPRRWRFVPALPSGPLGKVRAEDLVALFDELKPTPTERPREPDILAVRREADSVEIELFNRPDLVQLDGHFPRIAIVPGVAQIDWAVKLAARFLGLTMEAATGFQVKFHRLTVPDTKMILRLEHDRAHHRLSFAYRKPDEQVLTSGSIRVKGA